MKKRHIKKQAYKNRTKELVQEMNVQNAFDIVAKHIVDTQMAKGEEHFCFFLGQEFKSDGFVNVRLTAVGDEIILESENVRKFM